MLLLNDIMNRNAQLLTFQTLARTDDNQIRAQTDFRLKGEMAYLVEKSKEIQERLKECRAFIVGLRDKCCRLAKEQ
jgi:hypothetical protein